MSTVAMATSPADLAHAWGVLAEQQRAEASARISNDAMAALVLYAKADQLALCAADVARLAPIIHEHDWPPLIMASPGEVDACHGCLMVRTAGPGGTATYTLPESAPPDQEA